MIHFLLSSLKSAAGSFPAAQFYSLAYSYRR